MSVMDSVNTAEIPPEAVSGALSALAMIASYLVWIYGPKRKSSRQRQNHIKLVFQNILAGQEILGLAALAAIYHRDTSDYADNVVAQLASSRHLANRLCAKGAYLSPEALQDQLRVNEHYRIQYGKWQAQAPQIFTKEFSALCIPSDGWKVFVKSFTRQPQETLKMYDPFWENTN